MRIFLDSQQNFVATFMSKFPFRFSAVSALLCILLGTGCIRYIPPTQDFQPIDTTPVVAVTQDAPVSFTNVDFKASDQEINSFSALMRSLIDNRDFAGLEKVEAQYREKKERFIGGGWKIHSILSIASAPNKENPTDDDWQAHIALLSDWKSSMPDSILVRSILANTYLNWAWAARGNDYANKVPESAWPMFRQRVDQAAEEVREAAKLNVRSQEFFETAIDIALAQSLDREKKYELFHQAQQFDPTYQYIYTDMAYSLTQKWGGRPGEWEHFADDIKQNIGGEGGLKLYYLMVNAVADSDGKGFFENNRVSWADTKAGFQLIEKDYGVRRQGMNEFAHLSIQASDTQASCEAFKQLPNAGPIEVSYWHSADFFEKMKKVADAMCKFPKMNNQAK